MTKRSYAARMDPDARDAQILRAISRGIDTRCGLSVECDLSESTVDVTLKRLLDSGRVHRVRHAKTWIWSIRRPEPTSTAAPAYET